MREICDDLRAEHRDLDSIVAGLEESEWSIETPSPGWAIRDQIHHLGWFDRNAVLAIEAPDEFTASMEEMVGDFAAFWMNQSNTDAFSTVAPFDTYRLFCYVGRGRRFAGDSWPRADGYYKGLCR